jgi:hypothetical protein
MTAYVNGYVTRLGDKEYVLSLERLAQSSKPAVLRKEDAVKLETSKTIPAPALVGSLEPLYRMLGL